MVVDRRPEIIAAEDHLAGNLGPTELHRPQRPLAEPGEAEEAGEGEHAERRGTEPDVRRAHCRRREPMNAGKDVSETGHERVLAWALRRKRTTRRAYPAI